MQTAKLSCRKKSAQDQRGQNDAQLQQNYYIAWDIFFCKKTV